VLRNEVLDRICTEPASGTAREEVFGFITAELVHPRPKHGHNRFGQRSASFFSAFPVTSDVRAGAEYHIPMP
jgi:hypothetical protein